MTLRVCLDCTTKYSVGAALCPHCGSERGFEQGAPPPDGGDVPKISRHGGPTDAKTNPEPKQQEGGEPSSPGSSSETSSPKPETPPETSKPATPKRARTTGSRSGRARTGGSTARSTGGGLEDGTSPTESDD